MLGITTCLCWPSEFKYQYRLINHASMAIKS